MQLEYDVNGLLRDPKVPREAKKAFLSPFKEEFSKALDEYGSTNPSWNQAYQESKDIYRGLKARSAFSQFLEENANVSEFLKSKLTQAGLFGGILYAPGKLPYIAAALPAPEALRQGVQFAEFLKNSKGAQKYYWDATKAALDKNKSGFVQSIRKLDNLASRYDTENVPEVEEQSPKEGKLKILSGGFKS